MSFDAKNLKVGDRAVVNFRSLDGPTRFIDTIAAVHGDTGGGCGCTRAYTFARHSTYHHSWLRPFDPKDIPIGSEVYLDLGDEGAFAVRVTRRFECESYGSGIAYDVDPVPAGYRDIDGGNGFDSGLFRLDLPAGVTPADPEARPEAAFFYLLDAEDGILTFGGLGGYVDDEVAFFEDEAEAKDHAEQYALAHPDRDIAVLRSIGTYRATSTVTFTPAA